MGEGEGGMNALQTTPHVFMHSAMYSGAYVDTSLV